jgi:hypothetical protein
VSDPKGRLLASYGVMVLSKYKFHQLCLEDFPTRLGRKALLGSLLIKKGSRQLVFGTFHLESYERDVEFRKQQIEMLRKLTLGAGFQHAILCGDTNFASDEEGDHFGEEFCDCWKELYLKDENGKEVESEVADGARLGYTFDTEVNTMRAAEPNIWHQRNRIDRFYYTKQGLRPVSMTVIGREPVEAVISVPKQERKQSNAKKNTKVKGEKRGLWSWFGNRKANKAIAKGKEKEEEQHKEEEDDRLEKKKVTFWPSDHFGIVATFKI